MNELGKIAVITGATSGIGKEYAFQLAKKGYDLILEGGDCCYKSIKR